MRFAPKIIVFTRNKNKFMEHNKDFENKNNSFYSFGGIATTFEQVKKFLLTEDIIKTYPIENEQNLKNSSSKSLVVEVYQSLLQKSNEGQLTFEYIDCLEKLFFPLFFKVLIKFEPNDNLEKYTNFLYDTYTKGYPKIKKLLSQIKSMKNIPIEILSKYYARLYTAESKFYHDLNKDLGLNKNEKYLPFIKTLYEGAKLESLPLAKENILYRGSKISYNEINKIKDYLSKKIKDLPASIVFSRSFLSFSKDKTIAEHILSLRNENKNLIKVLYIINIDKDLDYDLSTPSDIQNISFHFYEKYYSFLFHHLKLKI